MQTMQTMQTNDYWTATAFAATKTPSVIYNDDGSIYQGYVNEEGEKHGNGILKTAIYVSGTVGDENSHLAKWSEFEGEWYNGFLHGQGIMRQMSEKGVVSIMHDGMWNNGNPVVPVIQNRAAAAVEQLIMTNLTKGQEFDFIASCDDQSGLPWYSD